MVHESRSTVRPQSTQTLKLFCSFISVALYASVTSSVSWLMVIFCHEYKSSSFSYFLWLGFGFHYLDSTLNFSSWTVFWGRSVRIVILRSGFPGNDFYYKPRLVLCQDTHGILTYLRLSTKNIFWFSLKASFISSVRDSTSLHIRLIAFLSAPPQDILDPNTSLVSG